MKIMTIFGTRPEAIKVAPLIKAFEKDAAIEHIICVTAQHRDMLDQVLETFDITPDFDLDLMKNDQDLSQLSAQILTKITTILQEVKPDFILIQGDTTTVLMSALAAFYQHVKIVHLEAGLRTGDLLSPWPEEGNRRLVSTITHTHLAPTEYAKSKLLEENIPSHSILVTGNSVIDALFMSRQKIDQSPELQAQLDKTYPFLKKEGLKLLVTLHRRESHDLKIEEICRALKDLSYEQNDLDIIFSVHPNPNVKNKVEKILSGLKNVHLIMPPAYLDFVYIMTKTTLILTDSGGIQEEAPSLNIPVLVAREKTERPEGVTAGSSILVGRDGAHIKETITRFLTDKTLYKHHASLSNPFGDGQTTRRVLDFFHSQK